MRPALVRVAFLLPCLLATALLVAPAASAAGTAEEPGREINIDTHAGGFHISVFGSENKGKRFAILYLRRGHQFAEYVSSTQITGSTFKARFGSLGELDYGFGPQGSTEVECFGVAHSKAAFTGTFKFTGERGYVHIDLPHIDGSYRVARSPGCKEPSLPGPKPRASQELSDQRFVGDGATLSVSTKPKKMEGKERRLGIDTYRGKTSKQATVTAVVGEYGRGVTSIRGVTLTSPARAFEWDFGAYTATVAPPAPFTGTARLVHHPDGSSSFLGSLRVPILGEPRPVRMAGRGFRPKLIHGIPDES
jgi:hypothetical protein